jgi:predicted GNAT family N-acyltransferase
MIKPTSNVGNPGKVSVRLITSQEELDQAHDIRRVVFVSEQDVPEEEEIDQYEPVCRHFLALTESGLPCGAARWRFTENGIKLERFAVLQAFRGHGVGSALVQAVLNDIRNHSGYQGQKIYLHAQLDAIPLYKKFGFQKTGPLFLECDIKHYKMEKEL